VDIENTSDTGGGYNVGWTAGGEWLKYSINAAVDGLYNLQVRVASSGDGGTFHIEFDGVNKTGAMVNSDSGGWQTWRTLTKNNIGLTAGPHVMRLVMDSSGANGTIGNFNHFLFTATATNPPPQLVHRYSFNEGAASTTAFDSIGTAHGALQGAAALSGDGKLILPGSNAYLDLPNGLISTLTNVTFETWTTWNGGGNSQRIFDFGNNSNGENNQGTGRTYATLTPSSSAGVLRFAASTNSTSGEVAATWTNALPIGRPTHIVVCYDFVAATTLLFVNGQRVGSGLASVPLRSINDINVWLGRSNWPDPDFNGSIDEFRIYNGVLADSATFASYAAGPDASMGARPILRAISANNVLQLSWPPDATGYSLEQATNLQAALPWISVTNAPVFQNGRQTISLPITNQNQFFRLRK
jgi:hypothetical protein